jgi:hypothetical protein
MHQPRLICDLGGPLITLHVARSDRLPCMQRDLIGCIPSPPTRWRLPRVLPLRHPGGQPESRLLCARYGAPPEHLRNDGTCAAATQRRPAALLRRLPRALEQARLLLIWERARSRARDARERALRAADAEQLPLVRFRGVRARDAERDASRFRARCLEIPSEMSRDSELEISRASLIAPEDLPERA